MKKTILILTAVFAFAKHGQTNDPALQEALQGHYTKAFRMFDKRCSKNDGYACGMVAYFYDKGIGVQKDKKAAINYYTKGCGLNDNDSCTILGYYYYKGIGVKKDLNKAITLLKKACKNHSKDACNYLKEIANIK
jgi:TPR repeat protein